MKNSVDLTEDSVFTNNHNDDVSKYFKRYRDGYRIPWRRPKKTIKVGLYDEFSDASSFVNMETINNTLYLSDDTFISYTDDFATSYSNYANTGFTTSYHSDNKVPVNEFPIGARNTIKCARVSAKSLTDKYKLNESRCKLCNTIMPKIYWNHLGKCEKCYQRDVTYKKNKIRVNNKKDWMTTKEHHIFNLKQVPRYVAERPWDLYDEPMNLHDHLQKELSIDHSSFWFYNRMITIRRKGINFDNVRGANPWQPTGRVPQEYDNYFDELTWKKALENRLKIGKSLLSE